MRRASLRMLVYSLRCRQSHQASSYNCAELPAGNLLSPRTQPPSAPDGKGMRLAAVALHLNEFATRMSIISKRITCIAFCLKQPRTSLQKWRSSSRPFIFFFFKVMMRQSEEERKKANSIVRSGFSCFFRFFLVRFSRAFRSSLCGPIVAPGIQRGPQTPLSNAPVAVRCL